MTTHGDVMRTRDLKLTLEMIEEFDALFKFRSAVKAVGVALLCACVACVRGLVCVGVKAGGRGW
jgi:hypothetical protein